LGIISVFGHFTDLAYVYYGSSNVDAVRTTGVRARIISIGLAATHDLHAFVVAGDQQCPASVARKLAPLAKLPLAVTIVTFVRRPPRVRFQGDMVSSR
jgi:hypothetical protein